MPANQIAELLALNEPDTRLVKGACDIGKGLALLALLLALTTPLGWLLQRPILRPELQTFTAAHVLGSAFMISLCVTVLMQFRRQNITTLRIVWMVVFVATVIVLIEYITPNELPI